MSTEPIEELEQQPYLQALHLAINEAITEYESETGWKVKALDYKMRPGISNVAVEIQASRPDAE